MQELSADLAVVRPTQIKNSCMSTSMSIEQTVGSGEPEEVKSKKGEVEVQTAAQRSEAEEAQGKAEEAEGKAKGKEGRAKDKEGNANAGKDKKSMANEQEAEEQNPATKPVSREEEKGKAAEKTGKAVEKEGGGKVVMDAEQRSDSKMVVRDKTDEPLANKEQADGDAERGEAEVQGNTHKAEGQRDEQKDKTWEQNSKAGEK